MSSLKFEAAAHARITQGHNFGMDGTRLSRWHLTYAFWIVLFFVQLAHSQNIERYKPLDFSTQPHSPVEIPHPELEENDADERVLVDSLDAIIFVDSVEKVSRDSRIDTLDGIHYGFDAHDSLVHTQGMRDLVQRYLKQPITLRQINELARDVNVYYRRCKQPIVDVVIPEQRITGGTLHLVVIESRIGRVVVRPGCYFDDCELIRWIESTVPGDRIYETKLEQDLYWLNQSPFRRVSVDFEKGVADGTTDVIFSSRDVRPVRGYIGADDTGVESLNFGRFFAGLSYGNLFGTGGTLSYQYTTDQDFARLEAHAANYSHALNRDFSFNTYASWASVAPELGGGLSQNGESWQAGLGLVRHVIRTAYHDQNWNVGIDFKSTNNNLEFAGSTVVDSNADLVQLRLAFQDIRRTDVDQYSLLTWETFVGPGGGLTGSHSSAAFETIRPDTSPDYIYSRLRAERVVASHHWQLLGRFTGQISSERLLFSETLGLGGFDTLRGFDQRAFNADNGWILNLEFGPRTTRWGGANDQRSLRAYSFVDMGNGYVADALPGEDASVFAISAGVGMQFRIGDQLICRADYGYGFDEILNNPRDDRFHLGLTWIPGRRP